ncbi:MAG: DNA-directed RNA polymerase subunit N [Candidatus Heimdallarchaeota archaeon]|nr:DNA-directed RNA polymerase subunit N [Candidatus Heimdallarchaeota archaeon]
MLIPVRCFSCGTVVADRFESFENRVKEGENPQIVLDNLGLFKYCCRRMLISQVNLIDIILPYSK